MILAVQPRRNRPCNLVRCVPRAPLLPTHPTTRQMEHHSELYLQPVARPPLGLVAGEPLVLPTPPRAFPLNCGVVVIILVQTACPGDANSILQRALRCVYGCRRWVKLNPALNTPWCHCHVGPVA